jgi:3-phosphoshikimate 1-carboxyvinyltransferase
MPIVTADRLAASAGGPLAGGAAVPGDKSLSHRALIFAAMAEGESRIHGLSDGVDVQRTADAVRALGADVRQAADGSCRVTGGSWRSPAAPIDCGNSGTTVRLLMGAVAGRPVTATFIGDESLQRRPMARVTAPLRNMGAVVAGGGTLPITIAGGSLRPIRHVNEPASAQVKSAILLAALAAEGVTEIDEPRPTRDHSERLLPAFGVEVAGGATIRLTGPQRLRAASVTIPGDVSAAAFPLVAAALVPGSEVTVSRVGLNPLRTGLIETLAEMGADIAASNHAMCGGEPVADLHVRAAPLRGVQVPAERAPRMIDEYPILAVAAACADGETVMHGLGELRHKESDRIAAIASGLHACGVTAAVEGDTLRVTGGRVRGSGVVDSAGDHRIAMAFLILGLVSEARIAVEGAQMIATSFPGFVPLMRSLGADIAPA